MITSPQRRGLGSTICHTRFTLTLPGYWADHWLYPEGQKVSHTFMTGSSFATWSKEPTEVRLPLSRRNWEVRALSPLMTIFQRTSCQVLEKDFSDQKADKRSI